MMSEGEVDRPGAGEPVELPPGSWWACRLPDGWITHVDPEVASAIEALPEIVAALEPFVSCYGWLRALEEIGDIDPMTDSTLVVQVSGGGGSVMLSAGDFRRAAEAMGRLSKRGG